ncbi:MAG: hypothetical protein IPL35_16745 [Sphingobacteriales bacterium]|nr:hypothetical protein [Sphingobacteriales bacterium]
MKKHLDLAQTLTAAQMSDLLDSLQKSHTLMKKFTVNLSDNERTGLRTVAEGREGYVRDLERMVREFPQELSESFNAAEFTTLLAEFDRWREVMLRAEEIAELSSDTVLALGAALMEKSDWANDSFQQGRKYNAALDRALEHIDRFNSRFGKSKEGNETDTPPAPFPEAAG